MASDRVDLAVLRHGAGPRVVLLHGLALDGRMWTGVASKLALAGYSTASIDLRGHGRSPVVDVDATLDDLAIDVAPYIDGAHVVGFSMGGMIAMRLAARGGSIRSLTLVSTSGEAESQQRRAQYEAMAKALPSLPRSVGVADAFLEMQFSPGWAAEHPAARERYRAMFLENDARGVYRASLAVVRRPTLLKELATVKAPTLVLAGERDASIPPEHGRHLASAIPGARFVAVERAAHVLHEEAPEAFLRPLLSHLREAG